MFGLIFRFWKKKPPKQTVFITDPPIVPMPRYSEDEEKRFAEYQAETERVYEALFFQPFPKEFRQSSM